MTRHPLERPSRFGVELGILESSSNDLHPFGPSQAVRLLLEDSFRVARWRELGEAAFPYDTDSGKFMPFG
ncbi:MAG: hypothetical protein LC745_09465 [Planctomycetia bacterium]|nr:hypothetical protein [Planctomycetia bacterium]